MKEFGLTPNEVTITPIHQGLINNTWKVAQEGHAFILQKVNSTVFQWPEHIAFNIEEINRYLKNQHPEYFFVSPVKTFDGDELVYKNEDGYFRVFPFVQDSHAINVVETPEQAYEGAKQFGKFTAVLSSFDCTKLKITIPNFHNLSLRYEQFEETLKKGNNNRLKESDALISQLKDWSNIVMEYEKIKTLGDFKLRVTHHDSKINNVLFDENNKGLCVIDLDTVMSGYFISDVGDMMRTYLCPASEEEKDFSKIVIRKEYYKAIVEGYMSEMREELTDTEKKYFFYSGKFSIYMQALRFLTDYLNDDKYYGAVYPEQNLVRATNQMILLQRFIEEEPELYNIGINS